MDRAGRPVEEVLPGVLARGRQLRRRRRIAVRAVGSLAIVTCLIGVAAAAASTGGPGHRRVVTATAEPTTVAPPDETSTSTTSTVAAAPPAASTTTLAAAPQRGTTTTSTLYCHNSADPRCGPFRWTTDPGPNAPLTVDVTYAPAHPHVGDTVTFHVTARDPDASSFPAVCSFFGEPGGGCIKGTATADDPYCGPMYGPWDPPRRPGEESLGDPSGSGVPHTFKSPGTYAVTFSFESAATFCGYAGPYASSGSATVQVTVDAATTSTTVTTR